MGIALPAGAEATVGESPAGEPYVVVLRDDARPSAVAHAHHRRHGAEVDRLFGAALKGYAGRLPPGAVASLRRDPQVRFVSPDAVVRGAVQRLPTGVDRVDGDLSSTLSGDGRGAVDTPVAVLDSGSGPHPDINRAGGVNCQTGNDYDDRNGHGTHVAGIIGARDDGAGVVGVAPSVPVYSVRVLDAALNARWSNVICGVDWVTANAAAKNIKVANLSLIGAGADDGDCGRSNADALHAAICGSVARGVTYVVSAGNDTAPISDGVPAAYDEVLTVTAAADFDGRPGGLASATCTAGFDDTAADFSNFAPLAGGDAEHTIAAPGVCIESTWRVGKLKLLSGTSMAAPHATGAAALCLSRPACANATPSGVTKVLMRDAARQPYSYGFGGDPNRPLAERHYGHLLTAAGY